MDTPHPVDRVVGQRLKLRRKSMGFSQQQLAAELGLTFQQVQKYERGLNRISASKLWLTSKFLQVNVSYFFADFADAAETDSGPTSSCALDLIATPEGERLATAFPKLDRRLQRRLVELVEAMQPAESGASGHAKAAATL